MGATGGSFITKTACRVQVLNDPDGSIILHLSMTPDGDERQAEVRLTDYERDALRKALCPNDEPPF